MFQRQYEKVSSSLNSKQPQKQITDCLMMCSFTLTKKQKMYKAGKVQNAPAVLPANWKHKWRTWILTQAHFGRWLAINFPPCSGVFPQQFEVNTRLVNNWTQLCLISLHSLPPCSTETAVNQRCHPAHQVRIYLNTAVRSSMQITHVFFFFFFGALFSGVAHHCQRATNHIYPDASWELNCTMGAIRND